MRFLKLLAIAVAAAIAGLGVVGMTAPSWLLEFGRALQTLNSPQP